METYTREEIESGMGRFSNGGRATIYYQPVTDVYFTAGKDEKASPPAYCVGFFEPGKKKPTWV